MTPDILQMVLVTIIAAATPLMIAAIGELVAERAGVLNLGVEGMMVLGAATGFAVAVETGSTFLGAAAGAGGVASTTVTARSGEVARASSAASRAIGRRSTAVTTMSRRSSRRARARRSSTRPPIRIASFSIRSIDCAVCSSPEMAPMR